MDSQKGMETYYYFRKKDGSPYEIKESTVNINTDINRGYVEMTPEQKEFYLSNPDASVTEVLNCSLFDDNLKKNAKEYLESYIGIKTSELRYACESYAEVSQFDFNMAIDKITNPNAECYFDINEARSIVNDFRKKAKKAMGVFDKYKTTIEKASTTSEIDKALETALNELFENKVENNEKENNEKGS